jgi:hypothetical protein
MNTQTTTAKRTIRHPEAFVGKVVNANKWNIPEGYAQCAMTYKLFPYNQLEVTFDHTKFEKAFLISNHIYVECAEWLSEEGYFEIMGVLQKVGKYDYYLNN